MAGRPPSWMFEEAPPNIFVDAASVDSRGRFQLPQLLRTGFLANGTNILCALEESGRVQLLPWVLAVPVRARITETNILLQGGDEAAADSLLLLEDRYRKLFVNAEGRIELPAAVTAHIEPGPRPFLLFVASYPSRVELWSRAFRLERLERASRELNDLP